MENQQAGTRTSGYPDAGLLRRGLGWNAVFSLTSGVALVLWPGVVAGHLGPAPASLIRAIGTAVALGGLGMTAQARRRRVQPGLAAATIAGDILWVLATALLLVWRPGQPTAAGLALLGGVGTVVGGFAAMQWRGLRRYAANRRGTTAARSMYAITVPCAVSADAVWRRLRDLGGIAAYHPDLQSVEVREQPDGTVRTCTDRAGRRWSELVRERDDAQRRLTLAFATAARDFPFPMTLMEGGWEVEPDGSGSRVTVWYEFSLRWGALGDIVAALIAPVLDRTIRAIVHRMERAEAQAPGAAQVA